MSKKAVKIQPIGKRVLVRPQEVEEVTAGGLVIPPSAQEDSKPEMGVVVKLGTGADDFEFSVKEGDNVFYKKYSPDELEHEGDTYFILAEEDILAVVG
jgi:chaperonin GroES